MNTKKCIALLRTVESGSISRAAEQMGYTQSAVSKMIADLESEWDVELLRRGRAGIEPSSVCRQLLPVLRAIAADYAELEQLIDGIHGLRTGLLRVGTFTSVADMWLPRLLMSFRRLYPNIEFELVNSENYAEIEAWIRRGKVDCGFISLPAANDLETHFLKRDTLVAVLPPDHPLAALPRIPLERLTEEPFIKLKEDYDYEISRFLDQLSSPPKLRYEVSSDHAILSMVEAGLGISVMHSLIAEQSRYHVVCRHFDAPQHRDIGIATAKNGKLSSAAKLFVAHVLAEIRTRMQEADAPEEAV